VFFQATLTIQANTTELSPVTGRLKVAPGITDYVFIGFPPGPRGLVRFAVWRSNYPLWPSVPGEWFAWDNHVYTFRDRYPITDEPLELILKGWNEDDTYPHAVTFALTIETAPDEQELRDLRRSMEMLGLFRTATP